MKKITEEIIEDEVIVKLMKRSIDTIRRDVKRLLDTVNFLIREQRLEEDVFADIIKDLEELAKMDEKAQELINEKSRKKSS